MRRSTVAVVMVLVLSLVSFADAYGDEATGTVFNDKNGNALQDAGERGIPHVLVSNGRDIVETDRAGQYRIAVTDDTIVFVIKPRGWASPVGPDTNISRFYYIHKPNGSPKMQYAGVAPTGPLPPSIDFPLQRQHEGDRFRVVCLGDTQTRNVEETQFLAHDILEDLTGVDAAFGVTLGDNVFNDLTAFEPLVQVMSSTGVPWRYVPGNHDHNHDAPTSEQTDESFERVFGPPYYSFNYGKVHFIVLNDIRHEAGRDEYHGGFGEQQLEFIKNDLNHVLPKQLVVLMMHIPIHEAEDCAALYDLLRPFPYTFSLSAHTHEQENVFIDSAQGWPQPTPHHHLVHGTSCGSWWGGFFDETGIPVTPMSDGGPNGYSFITFNGTSYSVDYRIARQPADYQMNIWLPDRIAAADLAKTKPIVNVFAGSARSRVEMRLDNTTTWTTMQQFVGLDPFYVAQIDRQTTLLKNIAKAKGVEKVDDAFRKQVRKDWYPILRGLPEPSETGHLWRADLPADLTPGLHTVSVRTTDMFGHTYEARRIFTVE